MPLRVGASGLPGPGSYHSRRSRYRSPRKWLGDARIPASSLALVNDVLSDCALTRRAPRPQAADAPRPSRGGASVGSAAPARVASRLTRIATVVIQCAFVE